MVNLMILYFIFFVNTFSGLLVFAQRSDRHVEITTFYGIPRSLLSEFDSPAFPKSYCFFVCYFQFTLTLSIIV